MREENRQLSIKHWTEQAEREWHQELYRLKYSEFLKTKYWEAVRYLVIIRCDAICEICRKRPTKEVHHLSYDIRGYEHRNLQGLRAVCRSCHARIHRPPKYKKKAPRKEPRR